MILEDLWSSRFYPAETVVPMSPKYREILEKMEHLQAQLPREQFTLVEQVLEQITLPTPWNWNASSAWDSLPECSYNERQVVCILARRKVDDFLGSRLNRFDFCFSGQ